LQAELPLAALTVLDTADGVEIDVTALACPPGMHA
jgi:hypothetical protein